MPTCLGSPVARWGTRTRAGPRAIEASVTLRGARERMVSFVYPSGRVGPAAVALLARLGYTDAFTEESGIAVIGTTRPLRIPRIRVSRAMTLSPFLHALPAEPRP